MSADRWVRCPYCMAAAREARSKREAEVEAMYGKVPLDAWKAAAEEVATPFDPYSLDETVREDWEIGLPYEADEPAAYIRYSAHCKTCNASVKFETTVTLGPPA